MKYNENQEKAIKTRGKDILVSAGAGSGKTFVMIERIADNIINHRVSVDELLVVTFTNAAASEMRLKLNKKLLNLLGESDLSEQERKYLLQQIDLMGQSDICTLHKFCQTLIQKYFYTIDLDPSFSVGEEGETATLKNKAINDVFEELAECEDKEFLLLANTFDDKRGFDKIKSYVYKIYNFLTNQPDIEAFKNRVFEAYTGTLNDNKFANIINEYVCDCFDYYARSFADLQREAEFLGFDALEKCISGYLEQITQVNKNNTFSENHNLVFNLKLGRLDAKTDDAECFDLKERTSNLKTKFSATLRENIKKSAYITEDLQELQDSISISKNIVEAMFALVDKFSKRYLKLKKERNILDFSDLEHFAYQILQNQQVLEEVKRKYKQIYVDEYQDINDIQESIILSVHKKGDMFLVGDVKQSIYGFRNTNPQIFLNKQTLFADDNDEDTVALPLNSNYRTDQKILDFVNFVFGILMKKDTSGIDYLPNNEMTSARTFLSKEGFPQVEVLVVDKEREEKQKIAPNSVYKVSEAPILEEEEKSYAKAEASAIFTQISQLLQEEKQIFDPNLGESGGFRDIEFGDITLLTRGRSNYLDVLLKELADLGVPVSAVERSTIFEEYEIKLLYEYLCLVNNCTDDIKLTAFLTSPIVCINEDELSKLRTNARDCESFYQCVLSYNEQDELGKKVNYALDLINYGREMLVNNSIYELLVDFCEKTHYLEILSSFEGGQSRVSNALGYLNSFIGKKYNNDLSEYLSNIDASEDMPKIVPEYNVGISVVGVETMHHSKGLEYPIVFLVDTGHGFNTDELYGDFLLHPDLGIGMYTYEAKKRYRKETISHSAIKIALNNKRFAENLRLLYVAMTRAKNHLFITGSTNLEYVNSTMMPFVLKATPNFLNLILSILDKQDLETLKNNKHLSIQIADNNVVNFYAIPCQKSTKFKDTKEYYTNLGDIDAKFEGLLNQNCAQIYNFSKSTITALKNSVTALNKEMLEPEISYNLEPREFTLQENLGESKAKIDTQVGIAYHKAMQLIDFRLNSVAEVSEFLRTKLTNEEFLLIDCGKIFTAIKNLAPLVEGARLLREQQFLMRVPLSDLINSEVEDSVLVQGVIDLIIIKNNQIYLLDYKTSNSKNVDLTAQNYKIQLNCYQKAVEGALNCKITNKFLYFFLQERLISFDNN